MVLITTYFKSGDILRSSSGSSLETFLRDLDVFYPKTIEPSITSLQFEDNQVKTLHINIKDEAKKDYDKNCMEKAPKVLNEYITDKILEHYTN